MPFVNTNGTALYAQQALAKNTRKVAERNKTSLSASGDASLSVAADGIAGSLTPSILAARIKGLSKAILSTTAYNTARSDLNTVQSGAVYNSQNLLNGADASAGNNAADRLAAAPDGATASSTDSDMVSRLAVSDPEPQTAYASSSTTLTDANSSANIELAVQTMRQNAAQAIQAQANTSAQTVLELIKSAQIATA